MYLISKKQANILNYIRKHNQLSVVLEKFDVDYIELQNKLPSNSIYFTNFKDINKDISNVGVFLKQDIIPIIEMYNKDIFRFWLPIIISILAIIISISALSFEIWKVSRPLPESPAQQENY